MLRIFLLLVFFCCAQLVTGALVIVAGKFMHLAPGETNLYLMPWATLFSSLLTAAFIFLTKSVPFRERRLWSLSGRSVAICAPLMVSAIAALTLFFELYPLPDYGEELFRAMTQSIWGILALVVVGPFVEELLFRGAIEGTLLNRGKSPKLAIGVSAVLFGVIHANPAQIPFALLIGVLLGWCYYRTRSLMPGLIYHFLNNGLAVWSLRCAPDFSFVDWIGSRSGTWMILIAFLLFFIGSFIYARKRLE